MYRAARARALTFSSLGLRAANAPNVFGTLILALDVALLLAFRLFNSYSTAGGVWRGDYLTSAST